MGRPTKYKPEYCETVAKLIALGAKHSEIAEILGVNLSTFYQWRLDYEAFSNVVNLSTDQYSERVARSLAEKALGYTTKETKVFNVNGELKTKKVDRHYPPDTTACIFWLKNRKPEEWRDVQERVHHNEQPEIDDLELARKLAFLLQRADDQLTKH